MSSCEKFRPVIKILKMGGNEDAFQQLNAALDRVICQILSVIPESDHVDSMCVVVELIEGHTEEEVKYTLGKMCLVLIQISEILKAIQGPPDLHQTLQQILPDRVQRLTVAEHELLQMQVQLDEVRKENVINKRSNIQLTGNLEDVETHLVELNLESSHTKDSFVAQGGETEILKLKIESMEVELEELKNINAFNDEILHHKVDDIDEITQKCEDLSHLNSQLMTRLEIMNRELNEVKIVTEGFDTKSEAGSASTGSGDSTGFTSVRGPESVALGNNDEGQKVSTTQIKSDKSIYGDVLESVSLTQQKLGLEETLNVSDFPDLKETHQRKSLDLFTATCKDMSKVDELRVEKTKVFVNIQKAFSKTISSTEYSSSTPQLSLHCIEGEWTPSNDGESR